MNCPACRAANSKVAAYSACLYRCNSCTHFFSALNANSIEEHDTQFYKSNHSSWINNPDFAYFNRISSALRAVTSSNNNASVLEIAYLNGDLLRYLRRQFPGAELSGIDIIKLLERNPPDTVLHKGDFLSYDFKGTRFSFICSSHVIEHIDDIQQYTRKTSSLLIDGGIAIIGTVNNDSLMYRLARALKKAGIAVVFDRLYHHHHVHHFSNRSLRTLLEQGGLKVQKIYNHNIPIKAVDFPRGNTLFYAACYISTAIIFFISAIFGNGTFQTVIAKKST